MGVPGAGNGIGTSFTEAALGAAPNLSSNSLKINQDRVHPGEDWKEVLKEEGSNVCSYYI
jgi:hypothetical protein